MHGFRNWKSIWKLVWLSGRARWGCMHPKCGTSRDNLPSKDVVTWSRIYRARNHVVRMPFLLDESILGTLVYKRTISAATVTFVYLLQAGLGHCSRALSLQVTGSEQQTATGGARYQAHKELLPWGDLDLPEIPKDDRKAEKVQHSAARPDRDSGSEEHAWIVYLLLSCDWEKTYVGVTSDLRRRLKQHNGELRGGAKSCRAGRPWEVVCTVKGFASKSEAFQFEWAWKAASKAPRRSVPVPQELTETSTYLRLAIMVRRQAALEKATSRMAFPQELEIDWQADQTVELRKVAKAL